MIEATIYLAVATLDDGAQIIADCDLQEQFLAESYRVKIFKRLYPECEIKIVPYRITDITYTVR